MIGIVDQAGVRTRARSRAARLIRSALTHRLAMRLKRVARSAIWSVKGAQMRNPRVPGHVESVLFVCLGNICRSPFGALLAGRLMAEAGRTGVTCTSAGIRTSQSARSPEEACRVAAEYGLCLDYHVPQLLTRDLIAAHDMVIVMEASQVDELRAEYPAFRDRIFLLALYDDAPGSVYERYNIADPFGQPVAAYEACYERMDRALRRWVDSVLGPGPRRHQGHEDTKTRRASRPIACSEDLS